MTFRENERVEDDGMEVCPEEDELEAMVASYERESREVRPPSPALSDEEYDDVFAELLAQEEVCSQPQSSAEHMDMS